MDLELSKLTEEVIQIPIDCFSDTFNRLFKKQQLLFNRLFREAFKQKLNIILENDFDARNHNYNVSFIKGLHTLDNKNATAVYFNFESELDSGTYLFSYYFDTEWNYVGNPLTGRIVFKTDLKINHADYSDNDWEGWQVSNLEQARRLGEE